MRGVVAALLAGGLLAVMAPPAAARPVDLDVLFVGAHPDDEAFGLAVYGAWAEEYGVRTGVVTVTRGEGGGNAAGPEEGPALGLLREAEERRAVARAGIEDVFNLDEVDFYYTVSAPLTREVWQERSTLERVVRVVRATRPEVIVTMDPAPTPGNHGHHQLAARLAIEAYAAAADPSAFRSQITREGLAPWRAKRLFASGAEGEYRTETGPACARTFTPAQATDETFGLWGGVRARNGVTWAQIARQGQREYVSQGWAVFPDEPSNPRRIGCDRFTQLAARVPYGPRSTARDAMLEGALVRAPGGLPLGTEFQVAPASFDAAAGGTVDVTVRARGPRALGRGNVQLDLPRGWTGTEKARLARLRPDRDATATLRVQLPESARPGRVRIPATLRAGGRTGRSSALVRVVPAVRGTLQSLPQVVDFRRWTASARAPQLDSLVHPVASLGVGETRRLRIDLRNAGTAAAAGTVALRLPGGFAAEAESKAFAAIPAGGGSSVTFAVTNTDPALRTGMQGGDYAFDIVTTAAGVSATEEAALNLVPVTAAPQASAPPVLDGVESPGEYGAAPALDLSSLWEGDEPRDAADASGSAKLVWSGDALYAVVDVTDDRLGTVLPGSDAKRHWRTDSVEVAIDPRGDAENTSTTFKVGVFPTTREGEPAAYRDADNRQGPVAETAPGFAVAARVRSPYTGYSLELRIPFAVLPAAVRSGQAGLNLFIYDSDTKDKTGQTRLGWSTWGGVQGDPYRWGRLSLTGFTSPPGIPAEPEDAVFPREAALSVASPQSILQAAANDVALGGGPRARQVVRVVGRAQRVGSRSVAVRLRAGSGGVVHVFAVGARGQALGGEEIRVRRGRVARVAVRVPDARAARRVAIAFEAAGGGTDSAAVAVRAG